MKYIYHPSYEFHIEKNVYNYLFRKTTDNGKYLVVRDEMHDFDEEDPVL